MNVLCAFSLGGGGGREGGSKYLKILVDLVLPNGLKLKGLQALLGSRDTKIEIFSLHI